jgi:fructan beta-fructosidase
MSRYTSLLLMIMVACGTIQEKKVITAGYDEPYRPQIHFSPKEKWMNDPNGMVYYDSTYHLFYQYYPDSTVWGPMHWGHATSRDLVHWQHQPIALFPDSLGYIFSGSAVADVNNTSGFGKEGKTPLVAIFTHHHPEGEKAGRVDYQNQSIAYSLDGGMKWTKYEGNPVVKNPGIKDFRDPKVIWYEEGKKWIMTLATKDRVTFYSSENLKDWKKESEFGKEVGAHGGVWECPDLFPLEYQGEKIWVLLVSINPGGPNKGSATQYFTGKFDGKDFTPFQTDTRWIDYGPDNYAGITWSNTGNRKIFLGWLNNWQYANVIPLQKWRGAGTIPRDLAIEKIGEKYLVRSVPARELSVLEEKPQVLSNIDARQFSLTDKVGSLTGPSRINLTAEELRSFTLTLSNNAGEKLLIGFDSTENSFFIDRIHSGKVDFEKGFAARHKAPRLSTLKAVDLTLFIDNASVELFADKGLTVMTAQFFPTSPYTNAQLSSDKDFNISSLEFIPLKSIWNNQPGNQ